MIRERIFRNAEELVSEVEVVSETPEAEWELWFKLYEAWDQVRPWATLRIAVEISWPERDKWTWIE